MTFKEVLTLKTNIVIVKSYGYTELGICQHYESFAHKRDIPFKVIQLDSNSEVLAHKSFIMLDNEEDLNYYEENGNIIVDDPEIGYRESEY